MASHCFFAVGAFRTMDSPSTKKSRSVLGDPYTILGLALQVLFWYHAVMTFGNQHASNFINYYDRDFRDFWVGTLLFSPRPKPNPDTQCMVHLPIHLPYKWPTVGKYTCPIECLGKLTSTKNNGLIWYCIPIDFERFFEGHHRFLLAKSIAGLSKKYVCPEYG